jgi:lipopolysaccharide/colanic/teichoic acid biosynthesis glycosyltransferase
MDAIVVAAVFFVLVRLMVPMEPARFFVDDRGIARLAPLIAILLLAMFFCSLYERKRITSRVYLSQQLFLSCGIALISQALISYLNAAWILPRNLSFYGLLASLVALLAWRLLWDVIVVHMQGTGTVLMLGADDTSHRIASHIASQPALHLRVAGSLTDCPERAVLPVLGGLADLRKTARELRPDLIISAMDESRDRMPLTEMVDLRYGGFRIVDAGSACELICRRVSARDLRPSRMLFTKDFDEKDVSYVVLISDVVVAIFLLIVGAPFALLYGVLLRLSGGGPAIVNETCAGQRGRPFVSHQFRTAEGALGSIGRFLHLNNWPQLLNVLLRRMSMVGPRPRQVNIATALNSVFPMHEYRQNMKPGITGWAQINLHRGPEQADTLAEVEFDLYYIRNQSFSLYTYILLHRLRAPT